MNIERLECLAKWLENGAPACRGVDKFDMTTFHSEIQGCGTACCIAGTAAEWWAPGTTSDQRARNADTIAAPLLGLTSAQAGALFFGNSTDGSRRMYLGDITADIAARTIRNLIETGEVTWQKPSPKTKSVRRS